MITLIEFLARDRPPSTSAKPACMKKTRAVQIATQVMLIISFISRFTRGLEGMRTSVVRTIGT